jgi:hypothetical protein
VSCGTDIPGTQTGFLTTYAYTTDGSANQVTTVTQGAQTRTIKTDSLGRTVSVTEPERGTTTYSYAYSTTPGLGLTVTRTRPRANPGNSGLTTITTTQYDTVGRPVSVTYNDGLTPNKQFDYDTVNSAMGWSETTTNLKGRMADMASGSGATLTRGLFSYDSVGRVLNMWQCTPSICGTTGQASRPALAFAYDWAGNLTSEFDGVSGLIGYTRSPVGELTSVSQESWENGQNPASMVSNVINGPNGPVSYTLGNGLSAYNSYDSLGRASADWLCTGTPAFNCGTQIYGDGPAWSGSRVSGMNDTVIGAEANFSYDEFNRLTSTVYNYPNGTYKSFGYGYDRYGNRWSQTAPQGGLTFSQSFVATTNQITAGNGYTYDAAGNMTNDGAHSYTYDAEGNVLTVDGGTTGQYVYDALNRRVRVQTSAVTYEYLFDYANRRISGWMNPSSGNAGAGNEGRIYWGIGRSRFAPGTVRLTSSIRTGWAPSGCGPTMPERLRRPTLHCRGATVPRRLSGGSTSIRITPCSLGSTRIPTARALRCRITLSSATTPSPRDVGCLPTPTTAPTT